jgi:predicted  nucleic acid-binding Zn-ribbon protein
MNEVLRALRAQVNVIEDALENCTTQQQRDQLRPSLDQAQFNLQRAINKIFQANDARVAQLMTQMNQAQSSLEKMNQQMADFAKVINAVSTAVKIGTEMAAMAA